jgi:hypothetical protein
MTPTMAVLAETFEGQPLVRPNDLVIDRKNGIYFTDPIPNPQVAFRPPPPGRKPLLFYITPEGKLTKASEDLQTVNGVQLSPDEKTLYATNAGTIMAFDVQGDGESQEPTRLRDERRRWTRCRQRWPAVFRLSQPRLESESSVLRGNCWERSPPACPLKAWVSRGETRRPFHRRPRRCVQDANDRRGHQEPREVAEHASFRSKECINSCLIPVSHLLPRPPEPRDAQ